jgi:hypothetical protein
MGEDLELSGTNQTLSGPLIGSPYISRARKRQIRDFVFFPSSSTLLFIAVRNTLLSFVSMICRRCDSGHIRRALRSSEFNEEFIEIRDLKLLASAKS